MQLTCETVANQVVRSYRHKFASTTTCHVRLKYRHLTKLLYALQLLPMYRKR